MIFIYNYCLYNHLSSSESDMKFRDGIILPNINSKSMEQLSQHINRTRKRKSISSMHSIKTEGDEIEQRIKPRIKPINVKLRGESGLIIHSLIHQTKKQNPQIIDVYKMKQRRKRSHLLLSQHSLVYKSKFQQQQKDVILTPNVRKLTNVKVSQYQVRQYLNDIQHLKMSLSVRSNDKYCLGSENQKKKVLDYNDQQYIEKDIQKMDVNIGKKVQSDRRQPALKISPMPILLPKLQIQMKNEKKSRRQRKQIESDDVPNNTQLIRQTKRRELQHELIQNIDHYSLNFKRRKKLKEMAYSILKNEHKFAEGLSPWQSRTSTFRNEQS